MFGEISIIQGLELCKKGGDYMIFKRNKTQSILEYIVVLAAIIAAVIGATGIIKDKITKMIQDAGELVTSKSEQLKSLGAQNQGSVGNQ